MSTAVEAGTSFERTGERVLRRYGLVADVLDMKSERQAMIAWDAYAHGGNDRWSRDEFLEMSRNHWLVNMALVDPESEEGVECVFGLELCHDTRKTWVEFSYIEAGVLARKGVLYRCAPAIVDICHAVATRWCHGQDQPALMHLTGRRGFARVLKALHIERDELGWISENQERFRHGLQ